MITFFKNLISSDSPESSKRFVGVVGSLVLIFTMFIWHTEALIYSVTGLVFGCFAINGIENKLVVYLKDKLFNLDWLPAQYNDKTYKSEVKFSTSFQIDSSTSSSKRFVWNF